MATSGIVLERHAQESSRAAGVRPPGLLRAPTPKFPTFYRTWYEFAINGWPFEWLSRSPLIEPGHVYGSNKGGDAEMRNTDRLRTGLVVLAALWARVAYAAPVPFTWNPSSLGGAQFTADSIN